MKRIFKISAAFLLVLVMLMTAACNNDSSGGSSSDSGSSSSDTGAAKITGIDDLAGKRIGVQLGTTGDIFASDYEEKGSTIERYNKGADAILALNSGKVDCVIIDKEPAKEFVAKNDDLEILEEPFAEEEYAIAIAKGNEDLLEKINNALKELENEGTLEKIRNNYIGDNTGSYQYESPADIKYDGELKMATNAAFPPYEYVDDDNNIVGIDADMAKAIGDKIGRKLVIEDMEFDSIIVAVNSGKADIGVAGMTVTEEREKNVNFSDGYTTSTQVIIVKK